MKKKIGTITLSELTYLSDPCYGTEVWCNNIIDTVPGEYEVFITRSRSKERWLAGRISSIIAIHKDYVKFLKVMPKNNEDKLYCGVDSGTCGIFNAQYYEQTHSAHSVDEDWYTKNVINMNLYKICNGLGAISSSGCGDGCYPVFVEHKDGNAFAIRIKFL